MISNRLCPNNCHYLNITLHFDSFSQRVREHGRNGSPLQFGSRLQFAATGASTLDSSLRDEVSTRQCQRMGIKIVDTVFCDREPVLSRCSHVYSSLVRFIQILYSYIVCLATVDSLSCLPGTI